MPTSPTPTYCRLTPAQTAQIEACLTHGIDLAKLREAVRAVAPSATHVELTASVEYDDGQSFYWRCAEIVLRDANGVVDVAEDALDDLREDISFGGVASSEDGDDTIVIDLDSPTLDQLYTEV